MNTTPDTGASDDQLDLLIVHAAKSRTFYPPLNVYQSCNRMAMGVLALAELAERKGYATRVLHSGIEYALDRHFQLGDYLRKKKPLVVGFSLQFHHGIVDTLRLIEETRATLPDAFIFVGGFTATFFARDLLDRAPGLDAVCKGDAEEPLLKVMEHAKGSRLADLADVPNLVWRTADGIRENEQSYCIDEDRLNDLVFTRFDLLEHGEMYRTMPKAFIKTHLPTALNLKFNKIVGADRGGIFWGLPVGRGCVSKCFYCGGGAKAQLMINKRKGVLFRDRAKVIETIRELKAQGYEGCYLSFDPHPWSQDYYVKLFREMQDIGLSFNFLFSSWGLPTREFLEEFAKVTGDRSAYLISPETGNETLRKGARAVHFTNDELLETLTRAESLGVRTSVYFCIGLPGETMTEFKETVALRDRIEATCKNSSVEAFLIEVEPAAPWYLDPDAYGVRLLRKSLDDFIRDHSAPNYSSMSHLGYTTAFFGDADIEPEEFSRRLLELKCKYFCSQRTMCVLMKNFWAVARTVGLAPKPTRL